MADEQTEQTQPEQTTVPKGRVIENVGMLDLTGLKSPEDLAGVAVIRNAGTILVPEGLQSKLGTLVMKNVGTVVPIPAGDKVNVLTGSTKLSGEALANPTSDANTLVVVGTLHVTTPVEKVGYQKLIVVGLLLAPKGSETALGAALTTLQGTMIYYSGNPRIFSGKSRFSSVFFDLIADGTSLVLMGKYIIEPDVTAELLTRKVAEITLAGKLVAPRALVPYLQALCIEPQGIIKALEDEQVKNGGQE